MGVEAIDNINRTLKAVAADLRSGAVDSKTVRFPAGNSKAVMYTLDKAIMDLEFLSRNLKEKGIGEKGLYPALKRAFMGLFGGF